MTHPPLRPAVWTALLLLAAALPARGQSLYADPRASRVGDIVTVVLAERTAAQRESNFQNNESAAVGGGGSVAAGSRNGSFGADAQFVQDSQSRNESVQRDLLSGTMTAQVVAVDSVGNLVLRGERTLTVNGATHLLRVSGTVRPLDVRSDNSLLSYQIANAVIEYRQAGLTHRWFRPGFWARAGAVALLAAAAVIALMAGGE